MTKRQKCTNVQNVLCKYMIAAVVWCTNSVCLCVREKKLLLYKCLHVRKNTDGLYRKVVTRQETLKSQASVCDSKLNNL